MAVHPTSTTKEPESRSGPAGIVALRRVSRRDVILFSCGMALAAFVGIAAPNGFLSAFAIFVLVLLIAMLSRPGEPQVLLYAALFQWLQAAALLFSADLRGEGLAETFGLESIVEATWLTLAGVLAFGAGMRASVGRGLRQPHSSVASDLSPLSTRNLFIAWLIAFPVFSLLVLIGSYFSGVRQILLSIAQIKWVLVFILAASVFQRHRGYQMLVVVIAAEAVYGLLGYFAEFKSVFIIVGLAAMLVIRRLTPRTILLMSGMLFMLLFLGTYWTAVKQDYRRFSNQGSGQQTVEVSTAQQLPVLVELIESQSSETLSDAAEHLVERIGYVKIFSWVLDYVPSIVPYQDGKLWLGALRHIVSPRVLDPEKPALDDSAETTEYTGIAVSGAEQGTSIGLGYIAESYVDFGAALMFLPIFAIGALVGGAYRVLSKQQPLRLLGMACATVLVAFGANLVETSNVKMLGGLVTGLVVFLVFVRFLGPRFILVLTRFK